MLDAGDTLEDVINGMREQAWRGKWRQLPIITDEDPDDYFPVYDASPHSAEPHTLIQEVKDFKIQYEESSSHATSKLNLQKLKSRGNKLQFRVN